MTSQCEHPTAYPRIELAGTSMCIPRSVQLEGEASYNCGEEVRSVFDPVCSEGAVLPELSQAVSWLKMHKQ